MASEYSVVLGGGRVALAGQQLNVGDRAPEFSLTGQDLKPVTRAGQAGRVLVIASVPSLDTGTCDIETRRFNVEAAKLGEAVRILTVSMDLPFAQKRWCGAAGVDKVLVASDHRDASFGTADGVLIPEVRLLARAVFVVDRGGIIRYLEVVEQTGSEPDYERALAAVRLLV